MSPWSAGELLVAEPVFDSGDLLGAVVTSSSSRQLAEQHRRQLIVVLLGGVAAVAACVLLASRLAHWVLRPVRMVDAAMTEIWHGHVGARIAGASGPPELRRVVTAFNGMSEKVEQLIYKQQEFVSNASHELRNPLNALLLRIEDLHFSLGDDAGSEIEHVREEGRRLARILDALLMLARDQAAAGAAPAELGALVRGRLDAWQPVARETGVAVVLDVRGEVWCEVDDIVVESALDAVVDNALKFAPAGSAVDVRVEPAGDHARVTVRDRGPGLDPEEIEHVADRFWRSPRHQNVRGAGLGLAIATEFLGSCGGRLEVAAADGGGLAVTLWVPREAPGA
nr:HAMP domain-containing sensor histidine kinase [Jiangella mangrovi]